jgi:hypothetical protein
VSVRQGHPGQYGGDEEEKKSYQINIIHLYTRVILSECVRVRFVA